MLPSYKPSIVFSLTLFALTLVSASTMAEPFTLTSTDISNGKVMALDQEFQGFGCNGGNRSPQLSWRGAPEGTEAFAITAYDPDAPTGSGWWHWQLVNIPKHIDTVSTGIGRSDEDLPFEGAFHISNDYGFAGFGGACPPKGHGVHRYQFTIYALSTPLELPENASGALTGYMINAHSLASSTIEALYERDQ